MAAVEASQSRMPSGSGQCIPWRLRCFDIAHPRSLSMTPSSGRAMCQDACDTVLIMTMLLWQGIERLARVEGRRMVDSTTSPETFAVQPE